MKTLLICKCGWEGTIFQARHFTLKELNSLQDILVEKSKKTVQGWHGSICPACESPKLVHIGDALERAHDFISKVVAENGWGDGTGFLFPRSFMFLTQRYPKEHKTILTFNSI
jgi:hypothetical protein